MTIKTKRAHAGRVRLYAALAKDKEGKPRETYTSFTPRDGALVVPPGYQYHGRPFLQIEDTDRAVSLTLVFYEGGIQLVYPDGSEANLDYETLSEIAHTSP